MLRVKALDAATMTDTLCSCMESNNLDYRKMIEQGYDGTATFSGWNSGVQKRVHVHAYNATI